jgi:hypothetical protein
LAVDLCRGIVLQESGSAGEALEILERAWRGDQSVGSLFFGYASVAARGRALAGLGRAQEGARMLRAEVDRFHRIGNLRAAAMAMAALGEILGQDMGGRGEADGALQGATDLASLMGMRGLRAHTLAVRGLMARAAGLDDLADSLFVEAKKTAAGLGWLVLEQRINAAAAGVSGPNLG